MRAGKSNHDGSFTLFYRDGWAYLTVEPPSPFGRPVYAEEVENRMRLLGVPRVRRRTIQEIIEAERGTPEPLVAWPEGRHLAAATHVHISDGGLQATVTVDRPKRGGAPPVAADIERELKAAGVTHGIDQEAIRTLVAKSVYGTPVIVASGTAPVHGRGRRVRYHFNTDRGKPYLLMEFGRINLKELNFIEHCREGDLLAELEAPVTAVDGRSVTGETLPAETDTTSDRLVPGPNTKLGPDETHLYAACDGNVRLDRNRRVAVEPVVRVKSVDYETGNIRFDGSVIVDEYVADGFVVEAGGDLQIGKSVGKATLKAGRNIVLRTGANSNGEGHIESGGDLYARFIESCSVHCSGNVFVEEAVMHSHLVVGKHCVLTGRRAEVIGGNLVVGGSLWCKKLGNFNEVTTRVDLGVAPDVLLEYRRARESLEAKQEELNHAEDQFRKLQQAIRDGHTEERVFQAKNQIEDAIPRLSREVDQLERQLPELRERLRARENTMLVVEEMIYPGSAVSFGNQEYRVPDNGARKTVLRPGRKGVMESGFDPRNKPLLDFDALDSEENK